MTHKEKHYNSAFVCVKYALLFISSHSTFSPILFDFLLLSCVHLWIFTLRKEKIWSSFCSIVTHKKYWQWIHLNNNERNRWVDERVRKCWKLKTVHENIDKHSLQNVCLHMKCCRCWCWWWWLIESQRFWLFFLCVCLRFVCLKFSKQ